MEPDEKDAVIAALQAALESFGKSMNELKKERDEARKQVLELKAYGVEDDQTIDRLIRECGEAREIADMCRVALHDAIERPKGVVPESAERFYQAFFPWEGAK